MKKVLITLMMSMFVYQAMAATKFQYTIPQPDRIAPVGEEDDGGSVDLGGIGGGSGTGDSQDPSPTIVMGGDGDHTFALTPGAYIDTPYVESTSDPYNYYGYRFTEGSVSNATFTWDSRTFVINEMFLENRGNLWFNMTENGTQVSSSDPVYSGMTLKINDLTFAMSSASAIGTNYVWYPVSQAVIDAFDSNNEFTVDMYLPDEPVAEVVATYTMTPAYIEKYAGDDRFTGYNDDNASYMGQTGSMTPNSFEYNGQTYYISLLGVWRSGGYLYLGINDSNGVSLRPDTSDVYDHVTLKYGTEEYSGAVMVDSGYYGYWNASNFYTDIHNARTNGTSISFDIIVN